METRCKQFGSRCIEANMVTQQCFVFPIFIGRQITKEKKKFLMSLSAEIHAFLRNQTIQLEAWIIKDSSFPKWSFRKGREKKKG